MTLDDFKIHIKQRLGWPVINIELSDEQFDMAIKEAITYYQRNHFDGSEQIYLPIQVTTDIKNNRYLDLTNDKIIGVKTMFDIASGSNANILSFDFIVQADAAWTAFRSGSGLAGFYNMMSYRNLIQQTFSGKNPIRFNYNRGRVYIDASSSKLQVGDWIVFDVTVAVDPELDERMFEDPWLNDYAEACVKRIWGQTLKKYQQVQLPGGIMLDGKTMFDEANEEKKNLEDEIISRWQLPMEMAIG